jgi:hypothetical protein
MKQAINILFYISGFGFGHLTRSVAVIEELLTANEQVQVTIKCHPSQRLFVQHYLARQAKQIRIESFVSGFRIVFSEVRWQVDLSATLLEVEQWIQSLEKNVAHEVEQIDRDYELILSDIVPEAFAVGRQLGLPAMGLSNFTWYEICKGFASAALLAPLRLMYEQADLLLEYSLSTGVQLPIVRRIVVGLICRKLNWDKIARLRQQYKRQERPLLFLSIGGALKIDKLLLCADADYLYTQGLMVSAAVNLHAVPSDSLDTQNYLAACDGVITKCGWSTVAEALIARKPLYILKSANGWVEENAILQALRQFGVAKELDPGKRMNLSDRFFSDADSLAANYTLAPERFDNRVQPLAQLILNWKATLSKKI